MSPRHSIRTLIIISGLAGLLAAFAPACPDALAGDPPEAPAALGPAEDTAADTGDPSDGARPPRGAAALGSAEPAPAGPGLADWYPYSLRPPFIATERSDDPSVIHAGNARFAAGDPPLIPAPLERSVAPDAAFSPGWWIVHFRGAVTEESKRLLDDVTGRIVREDGSELARWYLPNRALIAYLDGREAHDALAASPLVDFLDPYHPAYKLSPEIGTLPLVTPERVERATYVLDLDLIPGHDPKDVAAQAAALGARVITEVHHRGRSAYDLHFIVVETVAARILDLARIEGVRLIQETADGLRTYDISGGGKLQNRTLAADDGSSSPIVGAATFPLWLLHDLQGQGQLIGVVDTAIDWNNTGVTGCANGFPDTLIDNWGFALPNLARVLLPSVGSGGVNLKIPRADLLGGATLQGAAGGEHGQAAAGAALADFYGNNDTKWWEHDVDAWESWAPSNFSGLLGDGIAHEAQLYFTPVMSNGAFRWEFAGEFPANMATTLSNMAAAGVCTSNHSVGLAETNNVYSQTSVAHDLAGFDHPELLQCMAAGNAGAVSNALTSQACIKNSLAVGASDDVLRPEDRVTFSSIGPAFDGRLKPDVMAPGSDTAPRSGGVQSLLILPESNGSGGGSCSYQWTSGTSFSSPTIAGAGALVHQYFQEGRYGGSTPILDPSAALMKACLINAGHRLTGLNLGGGAYPNNYQGWGEPNLSDVLDLPGGARRLIAADIASSAGFSGPAASAHIHDFTVNSSAQRLRVTLVWTDEPGSAGTGKKLINDLHLRVTGPGGVLYLGNVISGTTGESITGGTADTLNNVECVIRSAPATGAWSVTVDPSDGNYAIPQGYALVITGDVSEDSTPVPPVADFSGAPQSGSAPLAVAFTDLSAGSVTSWSWIFGDGGSSSLQHPSHTYTTAGTYTVALTATGPAGSDTLTRTGYITVTDPPPAGPSRHFSFDGTTAVPGLGSAADEDIVRYDPGPGTWAWTFDGSDVGLAGTDVDTFEILASGQIVLGFDSTSFTVPGVGSVDDSDLVIFTPTSLGATTAGTFALWFDGSDVGLTTNNEDVDAVSVLADGRILVSTLGGFSVPGVSGEDEDVIVFTPASLGATTAGTWQMWFDGSDVGIGNASDEEIDALARDGTAMLFSTLGSFSAGGVSGADEDVGRFTGTFGGTTSGTFALELDLSAIGIPTTADVDGLSLP